MRCEGVRDKVLLVLLLHLVDLHQLLDNNGPHALLYVCCAFAA
jgi:hypothetical protein